MFAAISILRWSGVTAAGSALLMLVAQAASTDQPTSELADTAETNLTAGVPETAPPAMPTDPVLAAIVRLRREAGTGGSLLSLGSNEPISESEAAAANEALFIDAFQRASKNVAEISDEQTAGKIPMADRISSLADGNLSKQWSPPSLAVERLVVNTPDEYTGSQETDLINALRQTARLLDQHSADLEDRHSFRQADRLRMLAGRLRGEARSFFSDSGFNATLDNRQTRPL